MKSWCCIKQTKAAFSSPSSSPCPKGHSLLSSAYLHEELWHDLLGLAVMSNDAIHRLWHVVQHQVQVHLVLLWVGGGGGGIN